MPIARRRFATMCGLLLLPLAACNTGGPAYELPAGFYGAVVDMTSTLNFDPASVTIRAGETVLWRNRSLFAHTVTFDPDKAADPAHVLLPDGAEPFASGDIPAGEVYARKFTVPGTYRYTCLTHEDLGMHGTIVVNP